MMEAYTKTLAFILIIMWGLLTATLIIPIILFWCQHLNKWFCGGRRLLEHILDTDKIHQ